MVLRNFFTGTRDSVRMRSTSSRSARKPRKHHAERVAVFETLEDRTLWSIIAGRSVEDFAADGFSSDDLPIAGRIVRWFEDDGDGNFDPNFDVLRDTQVTGDDGNYVFGCAYVGTYFVEEELPGDWFRTAGPSFYTIALTDTGVDSLDNDFGSFRRGSFVGQAFEDLNLDGIRSPDEAGVANRSVSLMPAEDPFNVQQSTTDSSGVFSFFDLAPGNYELVQMDEPGWIISTANPASVAVTTSGQQAWAEVGSFRLGNISGRVFRDDDGDGLRDPEELGLSDRRRKGVRNL